MFSDISTDKKEANSDENLKRRFPNTQKLSNTFQNNFDWGRSAKTDYHLSEILEAQHIKIQEGN